ncbi:bifunctional preprotein translocase subunit SecD/SecF [Nitratireductor indicus C115]|uniref:Multifunctional fusion protein n=1 Tax=Nitratireductor indicus C115 TaxID=1231190 RepID=K2N0H6_9HYPH|nr:protein translocase subunit SecDF [Nitratireductor indicus]EKF41013.1 bifunctional preprotein translocase subunit SecD/SecF [Nitratireductor indicus C115]SFQ73796.1 SecD/SecF fusion protein [Nitratireductor indicus]
MLHFSRWQTIFIWLAVALGVAYAIPNIVPASYLSSMPSWAPSRPMTLGLDLQGGSHILLQIEKKDLIDERIVTTRDDIRRILRDKKIGYTGLGGSGQTVQVRIRDASEYDAARQALNELTQPISSGLFGGGTVRELAMSEPEPGLLRFTLTEEGINYRVSSALSQSIEVVSRRVNELGTTEPVIQRQGDDRILVQVPGLQDPQRLKDILGQTAKLTFQMVDQSVPVQEAINGRPPVGTSVKYSVDDPPVPYLIEDRVIVSGENLVDAQATFDQRTNEPVVSFRFDTKGATRFGQATQQNVGRLFAIILDDQVISAPQIREPILGGTGQISGSFSVQSANDLAVLLRAGALPATLTVIEERTVGPGLGQDSIDAGKIASVIGSVLVVAFMIAVYGLLGVFAVIALVANVTMIIAILSVLGATLTLPGIAGIVLTVGMAVDSSVLIFERIREERQNGRSVVQSVDIGFSKALATIIDANVTTLIAAVILFYLGSGPVRGFAVTLAIGIATTVFTAYTLTRWIVADWVRRRRPKELPRNPIKLVPDETRIGFMKLRRVTFTLSAVASIAAVALFMTVNMNYGIDFRGGSSIEVQSREGPADLADIRARLSDLNLGEVQVQEFGDPREVLIRIQAQDGGENAEQTVITKVRGELEDAYDFRRVEVVGPTVSNELARAGTIAVLVSLFAILIYIWLRFEWQFAVGAILATLHDVIMTVGFFVVSGIEFNLTSIAAILTIVGYSLNDTVVVYDRVRENLRRFKKMPLPQLLDLSMNQTLSRTTMTSLTTLLALVALFIFGGEVIRSFTAAMIFGVVIGTYSSIFIAGPLLILFRMRPGGAQADAGAQDDAEDPAAGQLPAK